MSTRFDASCMLRRLPDGTKELAITPRFLAWVDILILRSVFASETSMLQMTGGNEGLKEIEKRCYEDHCKPGARAILESKWRLWMSGPLYTRTAEGKQGRRRTAEGHPLLKKIDLPPAPAPHGDGEGADAPVAAASFLSKWE